MVKTSVGVLGNSYFVRMTEVYDDIASISFLPIPACGFPEGLSIFVDMSAF